MCFQENRIKHNYDIKYIMTASIQIPEGLPFLKPRILD